MLTQLTHALIGSNIIPINTITFNVSTNGRIMIALFRDSYLMNYMTQLFFIVFFYLVLLSLPSNAHMKKCALSTPVIKSLVKLTSFIRPIDENMIRESFKCIH